jgi:hypothetical protein
LVLNVGQRHDTFAVACTAQIHAIEASFSFARRALVATLLAMFAGIVARLKLDFWVSRVEWIG